KGTRTERGFKQAFAKLFDQDVQTFTGTMFLNVDQLQKQLDKEEFQKIGSMAAFRVLKTQFQHFINSRFSLDDDGLMTRKPIYDEEPMAEVQLTADNNVFAIGQQHTMQPEFNNEGNVDQNAEQ
ncbi:hypothetical protein Tco_0451432, partial [Tanacetum coccineum]